MPEGAIYVGRPTKWGNPFKLTPDGQILYYKKNKIIGDPWCYFNELTGYTAQTVINTYRDWITGNFKYKGVENAIAKPPDIMELEKLRGHDLACFCPLDQPCHADVLIELLDENLK